MADILTRLSNKYGCDKSDKNHRYTRIYHKYFEKDRHREFNMLEFGFGEGRSIKVWLEYFTRINLVSVDKMQKLPNDKMIKNRVKEGRFKFVSSDQIDMKKVLQIFDEDKRFYIIIDDASHVAEDQQYTLGCLFQFISSGGWYIVEDLKCKRSHSKKFEVEADKTLKVLKKYLKTGNFNSKVLTPEQNLYLNENIESVEIFDKIAFIKKG